MSGKKTSTSRDREKKLEPVAKQRPEPAPSNAKLKQNVGPPPELTGAEPGFLAGVTPAPKGSASPPGASTQKLDAKGTVKETPALATGPVPTTTEEVAPDPATQPVEFAQWQLTKNETELAGLKAAAETDPTARAAYEAAIKTHTGQFRDLLGKMTPDQQRELLQQGGQAVADRLLRSVRGADPALVAEVVGGLMQAGESLGRTNVALLGTILAKHNSVDVRMAIQRGMLDGKGALLAVSALRSAEPGLERSNLSATITGATNAVNRNFETTSQDAKALQGTMIATMARMRAAGLTNDEIKTWETEQLEKNKDLIAAHSKSAERYASTLEGQAYGLDTLSGNQTLSDTSESRAFSGGMKLTGELAFTDKGDAFTAAALQRKGRGERTWVDTAKEKGGLDDKQQGLLDRVIQNGGTTGVAAMAASGNIGGMREMLDGIKGYNPGSATAIDGIMGRLDELKRQGIAGEALPAALASAFKEGVNDLDPNDVQARAFIERMAMGALLGGHVNAKNLTGLGTSSTNLYSRFGADLANGQGLDTPGRVGAGDLSRFKQLGMFGDAVSLLQNGMQAFETGDWKAIASTGASALGLGAEVAAMMGSKGFLAIAGKANLAFSVAMSAFDTYSRFQAKDYAGMALASAPMVLAGAGAAIGSVFPVVGTLVGAGIGAAIGGVIQAVGSLFGAGAADPAQSMAREAIEGVLKQRGVDPAAAKDLAELFSGPDAGDARSRIEHMARRLGTTPDALMERLAKTSQGYRDYFIDQMNDTIEFEGEGKDRELVRAGDSAGFDYIARQEIEGQSWTRARSYWSNRKEQNRLLP